MTEIRKYKLLKDLPMYKAGTIITHSYDVLPSKFNSGVYHTDGEWYTEEFGHKVMATKFLEHTTKWCVSSQRDDTKGWFESYED